MRGNQYVRVAAALLLGAACVGELLTIHVEQTGSGVVEGGGQPPVLLHHPRGELRRADDQLFVELRRGLLGVKECAHQ